MQILNIFKNAAAAQILFNDIRMNFYAQFFTVRIVCALTHLTNQFDDIGEPLLTFTLTEMTVLDFLASGTQHILDDTVISIFEFLVINRLIADNLLRRIKKRTSVQLNAIVKTFDVLAAVFQCSVSDINFVIDVVENGCRNILNFQIAHTIFKLMIKLRRKDTNLFSFGQIFKQI